MLRDALARLAWTVTVGAAFVWPLDRPAAPTSTFGEYRRGHFHGGLDLSTQQIVGLPVRALDAGEVVRVRASGVGYGRGLYLRLADGRTAVYGHLDGFAPDLARWIADLQDSTGQYEQDLAPPPGRFRYRQGELVGYAGDSGAGPPHLHLEVRSGDTAIDPLSLGLSVPDRVSPVLAALWVYPASAAARVEGTTVPLRVPLARRRDGAVRAEHRVRVSGPVRVAVEGFDLTEAKPNRLGLHSIEAALDGAPAYAARFDSVSWLDPAEADVVFDARVRAARGQSAYALTPPAGLRCLALRRAEPAWQMPIGAHALRVTAADLAGNTVWAEAVLEWVEAGPEIADPWAPGQRPGGGLDLEFFPDGVVARGAHPGGDITANLPTLGGGGLGARGEAAFELADGFFGPVEVSAGSGAGAVTRRFLVAEGRPGWKRELRSSDGVFVLELESGSLFERYPLAVEVPVSGWRAGGRADGDAAVARYRVEPAWLPLREPATVRLRLPEGMSAERVGLFHSGPEGRRFLGGPDLAAGVVTGRTRALGEFVAVRDTVAPQVGEARVRPGGGPPGAGARPIALEVRWRVGDRGAGIDAAACTLAVDGRRVAVEFDPEAGACRWRPAGWLPAGRHAYVLQVADRLGNRGARAGMFRVR